ncbi:MAG: sodium:solute symporter family protein [Nitrososphaerales archaeon]
MVEEFTPFALAIFGFLAVTVTVGVLAVKLVKKSTKRYIVAGKSLPLFFVGTMLAAQSIDGNSSLGNVALVYQFGFWAGASIPIGLGVCLLLTGFIFARRLNRMNMLTLPDYYFRRYGNLTEVMSGILMALSFIVLVAGNLAASGFIISTVLGSDFFWGILIATLIVLVYTYAGGLFSCAYTDIFQIYIAIFAFWAAFLFFLSPVAPIPWDTVMANIPPAMIDLSGIYDPANGALLFWAAILALGLGDIVALDFMERVFAADSGKTAARGALMGGGLTLFTVVPTSFLGLIALTYLPQVDDPFTVYPLMAMNHAPFWIGVLMLVGVLGAGMSTANGGILAIGSVISRNLIQGNIIRKIMRKEGMSDKRLLLATRLAIIPMMGAAFTLGYLLPQPGIYLILAFDIVFAGCLVPLFGGLFWKKANAAGAIASIIVGSSLRLFFFFTIPAELAGLDTMIPPLASLAVFIGVCLGTQQRWSPRHEINYLIPADEDAVTRTEVEKWVGYRDIRNEGEGGGS